MMSAVGAPAGVALGLLVCLGCQAEREAPPRGVQWRQVGSWSGRGNQQLETFPIERGIWRVVWETMNEAPAGSGAFKLTAHSGDSGREIAEVVAARGNDRDVAYVDDMPRRYYLVVASANIDWSITVEEPLPD